MFFFNSQSSIYDVLYDRSVHSTSYFAAKQPTGVSASQTLLDTLLNNRPIHIAYRIHNHFWLKTIFHLLWIIFQTSILHLTNVRQQDSGLPNSFGHQTSAFLFNLLTSLVRHISKTRRGGIQTSATQAFCDTETIKFINIQADCYSSKTKHITLT